MKQYWVDEIHPCKTTLSFVVSLHYLPIAGKNQYCDIEVKHFFPIDRIGCITSQSSTKSLWDGTRPGQWKCVRSKGTTKVKLKLCLFNFVRILNDKYEKKFLILKNHRKLQLGHDKNNPLNLPWTSIKGIHNTQYLPNDFFALSTFLDDLKPSHLNLSIQICP